MNTSRKEEKLLKKAIKKENRKEKRLAQKQKREIIRKKYEDEAFIIRFSHVYASIITRVIICFAAIFLLVYSGKAFFKSELFANLVNNFIDEHIEAVYAADAPEEIYEMCPIDEEGAKRINQIPDNNKDDSWTFCVYIVGADLEDMDENDLSAYVTHSVENIAYENSVHKYNSTMERLQRLEDEVVDNGLDMPKYLYKIVKPIASSSYVTDNVVVASQKGCASTDIEEMCAYPLPENITIVLQTGGAKRWSNALVNPNRTQRFVIKNGLMKEDVDMHLQDSCNPDTLADFIKYCDKNYHSDHMGLIMWDHGGGVTGYGVDRIFNTGMTLADINTALSKAIKKNDNDPYFDLIGFDACLMATTDTAKCLEGYGKYLASSEEIEPGEGWDYTPWLEALANDPAMSAAKIGRNIADTYMDYYLKGNNDFIYSCLNGTTAVTFSIVDIQKAAKVDEAYEKMNEKFLKLIAENSSVLTDMSRCAAKTMRYCGSAYSQYNTIDLGTYLDYLSELYPDECEAVRKQLKEAVLYTRSNHYLAGSQGLSIYFPVTMDKASSLYIFTDYVYNISDKKCTNALYYYKVAGCLNDEMKETVNDVTGKELETLNSKLFYDYQKISPDTADNSEIVINVGEELQDKIQEMYIEIAGYDETSNMITYYGTDDCCDFDGDGKLVADVDGKWFAINGSFLDAKVSFTSDMTTTYNAKVLHNGVSSYLTFTVNNETGEITIDRVVKIPDPDSYDYDAALRVNTDLNYGDTIIPVMRVQDARGAEYTEVEGKKVKYKANTQIELIDLPDGDYLHCVVIANQRGDEYYSPIVKATFNGGKTTSLELSPEFVDNGN